MFDLTFKDILQFIPQSVYKRLLLLLIIQIAGLFAGRFLGKTVYRLPRKINLFKPGSYCADCGYKIKWYNSIPVISYVISRGKCRNCKSKVPVYFPLIEIFNSLLWVSAARIFLSKSYIYTFISLLTLSLCLVILFLNINGYTSFKLSLFFLPLCIIAVFFDPDAGVGIIMHFLAFISAFSIFFGIALISGSIKGNSFRLTEDIMLAGFYGLFLGWDKFLICLFITSVSIIIALPFLIKKREKLNENSRIIPFLTTGFIISLLFGTQIITYCIEKI